MSAYSFNELDRMPLMVAHSLFARAEREIDEIVRAEGGACLWAWEHVKHPGQVMTIYCLDRDRRQHFCDLGWYVRKREEQEIEALLKGRAA